MIDVCLVKGYLARTLLFSEAEAPESPWRLGSSGVGPSSVIGIGLAEFHHIILMLFMETALQPSPQVIISMMQCQISV